MTAIKTITKTLGNMYIISSARWRFFALSATRMAVFILLMAFNSDLLAQFSTQVTVTDVQNKSLSAKMEANATALLSELNDAFFNKRKPQLNQISISADTQKAIRSLWEVSPIRCMEPELIERGLVIKAGYQIRNIPIFVERAAEGRRDQEIVMNFGRDGQINDFFISIAQTQYRQIIAANKSVEDLQYRQLILDFVEQFRTAYNTKDLNFLTQIYSDDALIITGKVVKQQLGNDAALKNSSLNKEQIVYQKQTKKEYLSKLAGIFQRNSYINIDFDQIKITQSEKWDDLYGVSLRQSWNTKGYSDVGFVFLMIDFKDKENPIIHVRTWQPEMLNGQRLAEDDVFGMGEFNISR